MYAGTHSACLNLHVTLAGNGVDADVEIGASGDFGVDAHVLVNGADMKRAAPIVEAFKRKTGRPGRT